MIVWRITHRDYVATALDGRGAATYGGRWTSRGVRVAYTAENRALAILELRVHLTVVPPPAAYVLLPVTIPDSLRIERARALPKRWHVHPAPPALAKIGDRWAQHATSAVLRVPSAVVRDEHNYLLNPLHPDFARIRVGRPEPVRLDGRLF